MEQIDLQTTALITSDLSVARLINQVKILEKEKKTIIVSLLSALLLAGIIYYTKQNEDKQQK
jgi:hypothetical protein